MNIDEAQKLKQKAELNITAILYEFTQATNLKTADVKVARYSSSFVDGTTELLYATYLKIRL